MFKLFLSHIYRSVYYTVLRLKGVRVGNGCIISRGAKIDTHRGTIVLENYCTVTHGAVILSHDATRNLLGKPKIKQTTTIGRRAFIGVNAVVMPGVSVGRHAIVGAGAIVTRDVPAYGVVVGNPARLWGEISVPVGFDKE